MEEAPQTDPTPEDMSQLPGLYLGAGVPPGWLRHRLGLKSAAEVICAGSDVVKQGACGPGGLGIQASQAHLRSLSPRSSETQAGTPATWSTPPAPPRPSFI
ncbi:hypothetical protein NDU88_007063 [Pleurodeles waltl]|uniref:Uncharacterized protein n=1 Tax=Pleurodeles waltl TaxID=8319 RepID=A0AAV7N118_PLEWA|nr:hypothetical protein NDU88_007063 [Pleurodeles waltl]